MVDAYVKYAVQETGRTIVTHEITLENAFSTLYATSYTLSLENISTENIKAYSDQGAAYIYELTKDGDKTNIKIAFPNPVVGKGAKRHFFVAYENGNIATRTGEVWEVSIPRLADENSFRNYTVTLSVPDKFGFEAYISPRPQTSADDAGSHVYTFDKESVSQTGITAGFGQFQVFIFNLAYHLENPLNRASETEIALPPDTAFQRVYLETVEPKPNRVRIDEDGNWLALYKLSSRQRIDVKVMGSVQIFASFRPFPKPTPESLSANLKETQFWQVQDPEIKALAQRLKTPREIYNFVSETLKYDFSRVRPNVERMGASSALKSPETAICMEFTDTFIAIARAAGIPAREINGYAYTENPDLQPLSLVADVLHSWPEYYDKDKGAWIPIDPTWASTTGGVNFFDKLDLRHFTFVIHGKSDTKPYAPGSYKLGVNPQKDVFVSFGKLPKSGVSVPTLTAEQKKTLPFFDYKYNVKIYNPGPTAIYNLYPEIFFDKKLSSRDFIQVLPPFETYDLEIKVPYSFLGKDTPDKIKIVADGAQIEIPTNKSAVVINSLIVLFILFIGILFGILIKLKKIRFDSLTAKIAKYAGKFGRKAKEGQS